MKIYTRTGDTGETSLFGGARVRKDDARIEAYGTIDELNSVLGVARASWPESSLDGQLHAIQSDLFDIGAHLASPGTRASPAAGGAHRGAGARHRRDGVGARAAENVHPSRRHARRRATSRRAHGLPPRGAAGRGAER